MARPSGRARVAAIAESGAAGRKDMGKVMGLVKAEGRRPRRHGQVSELIKLKLASM
jgi:uncharacterized protein YqeY